jgi:hypothetical protein
MPLSQALAYNVEHLETAAEHWTKVADHRESTFADVRNRAHSIDWTGAGADAMHEHIGRDFQKAISSADDLREAAGIARSSAGNLDSLHRRLLYNIEDVQNDGFVVTEDYTALNARPTKSLDEYLARQQLGVQHTADLRLKATELTDADARVGARLQTATAGEGKIQFTDHTASNLNGTPPQPSPQPHTNNGRIQAVGHGWKQDPPPPPPSDPFAGWTDEQKQQAAVEIAHGHAAQDHFPNESEPDVARRIYNVLKDPWKVGASEDGKGLMVLGKDGTIVLVKPGDAHYGTAFVPEPTPNTKWQTPEEYFNAKAGELVPLPPPTPGRLPPLAPGEMAPPIISEPPTLPSAGQHPAPNPLPPTVFDHPPAAVPPTVLDHPPLPPWLQDPSPPGFHVTPSEPPPIFSWDMPDPPPVPPPMPPPASAPVTIPSPLPPGAGPAAGAGAVVGGLWIILHGLSKLPHLLTVPSP